MAADFEALAARLLADAPAFVRELMPDGELRGSMWVKGYVSVNLADGHWAYAEPGEETQAGDNLVSLYALCRSTTLDSAVDLLLPEDVPTAGFVDSFPSELPPLEAYADEPMPNGHDTAAEFEADEPEPGMPISIGDFYAYMPSHQYLFVPSRELWPAASVNSRVPWPLNASGKSIKPSLWLDQFQSIEQMTWAPGERQTITGRLVTGGGWIEQADCTVFNLYVPPVAKPGDARQAARWVEHLQAIYGESAEHIVKWLAHRVQFPGVKINHALVLGGAQGIGKDTLLEPVKHAIGPWNFVEVTPSHLLGRFNGFVKSVILRINEARDLGEVDRFSFYDHMKTYTAAPPDVLRCDEKNLREHAVVNVCGVIITSNHKTDGIYLPADDRRHYVAWSALTKEHFSECYWRDFWGWYAQGGIGHVVALLAELDLSRFDAKAPPPKTAAFRDIVDANRAPEDAELADVLDVLGNPDTITLDVLRDKAAHAFSVWLEDRKNRRQIPHRLEAAGYVPVRNGSAADGLWKLSSRRQMIYAKSTLSINERCTAATLFMTNATGGG